MRNNIARADPCSELEDIDAHGLELVRVRTALGHAELVRAARRCMLRLSPLSVHPASHWFSVGARPGRCRPLKAPRRARMSGQQLPGETHKVVRGDTRKLGNPHADEEGC
jgi:hypothetical protein